MKAIVIEKFGGPEVLKAADLPKPYPGEGQILVRVCACGLNPLDYKVRKGSIPLDFKFPIVLGYDVSGVVEAVGKGAEEFQVGDEVFYSPELLAPGAYAEYHVVEAAIAAFKPEGLTHSEAASVPIAAGTAWQALFDRACIDIGDTVLVQGGAGGVGSMAVQLANWAGCEVMATASAANSEYVEELGADLVIDYQKEDFVKAVMEATSGQGVDVVLDTVGGEVFTRSFEVLAPEGCVVAIAPEAMQGRSLEDLRPAFFKNADAHFHFMQRDRFTLDALARLLERGFIEPLVEESVPFDAVSLQKAHAKMETGHGRGKMVLEIAEE
jgi:NADPH2:quinone reductase